MLNAYTIAILCFALEKLLKLIIFFQILKGRCYFFTKKSILLTFLHTDETLSKSKTEVEYIQKLISHGVRKYIGAHIPMFRQFRHSTFDLGLSIEVKKRPQATFQ